MRPFSDVDLHAFVDNQVGANRREAISAFLKQWPAEAERVAGWLNQSKAIQAAFAPVAGEPIPLWLTVGQIVAEPKPATARASAAVAPAPARLATVKTLPRRNPRRVATMVKLALAFAAGLSVPYAAARWSDFGDVQLLAKVPSARQAIERRALEAHRIFGTDAERPAEVADIPAGTLKRWLERRVSFAVTIPDLRADGWTLRGGRIVPADRGPGALLIFESAKGDRLSLFICRVGAETDDEVTATGEVASWIDGSLGYALVTSRSQSWLAGNARQLASAVRGASPPE